MKVKVVTCSPTYSKLPIASWLIKFFQKTNFSHLALEFEGMVIDCTSRDCRLSNALDFKSRYKIQDSYEIEIDADFKEFTLWCSKYLNTPYGYMQLVGLLGLELGIIKNNPFGKDSKKLICNELVALFLRDFKGLKFADSDNVNLVSIAIIAKHISEQDELYVEGKLC